jgi:UrcA family protein
MRVQTLLLIATACSIGGAASAYAEPFQREPTQVIVSARDVDFRDARSVASFDERLRRAAIDACDSGEPSRLAVKSADSRCAHESWEAAARSLHQPLLSQLHGRKIDMARGGASNSQGE